MNSKLPIIGTTEPIPNGKKRKLNLFNLLIPLGEGFGFDWTANYEGATIEGTPIFAGAYARFRLANYQNGKLILQDKAVYLDDSHDFQAFSLKLASPEEVIYYGGTF